MIKAMLFVFLLTPTGDIVMGNEFTGTQMREFETYEACDDWVMDHLANGQIVRGGYQSAAFVCEEQLELEA